MYLGRGKFAGLHTEPLSVTKNNLGNQKKKLKSYPQEDSRRVPSEIGRAQVGGDRKARANAYF